MAVSGAPATPFLRALLLVAGIVTLVVVVYAESAASLATAWTYSSYRHGVLVLPIVGFLLWRIRMPLAATPLRPWALGLVLVAALVPVWLVARASGVETLEHLCLVLLVLASVATCLGTEFVRRAAFPLFFLLAAVPVGDSLIPSLMRVTADISAWLLRLTGVPVFRHGQFLTLPGGQFEVADVCSGLNSLIAGTIIALLFAYLNFASYRRRVLFVLVAAISLVLANALRAFIVMLVASATEMRVFTGRDHVIFGWVLFGLVVGVLFWFGARHSDRAQDDLASGPGGRTSEPSNTLPLVLVFGLVMLALTAQPLRHNVSSVWWLIVPAGALLLWTLGRRLEARSPRPAPVASTHPYRGPQAALVLSVAAALLVFGPMLLARLEAQPAATAPFRTSIPQAPGCMAGPWIGRWQPGLVTPDARLLATYRCGTMPVNVFVGAYRANASGFDLTPDDSLVPAAWPSLRRSQTVNLDTVAGPLSINALAPESVTGVVWYWYVVDGAPHATALGAKLAQVAQILREGRADGALIWLEAPLLSDGTEAVNVLGPLARALHQDVLSGLAGPAFN